jgi:hypothetical protein
MLVALWRNTNAGYLEFKIQKLRDDVFYRTWGSITKFLPPPFTVWVFFLYWCGRKNIETC